VKGTESETKLLEECLSFAEHHYGDRVLGKSYRERDSTRVDNWFVDIITLYDICYIICLLSILEPWRMQLDLKESEGIDCLHDVQRDSIYENLRRH
jgi:hypothetical protein